MARIALTFILLVALAVRIYALGRAPLWLDEQCQLLVAQTNSFEAYWQTSGSLGPIGRLSYLETWLARHLGADTRALLRLPSVLWGVGAVALTFALGRRWFSTTAGLFAAALLSVFGIHIQYSREARGYSLLTFLTLAFALQLDSVAKRRSPISLALIFIIMVVATQIHPVFWVPASALTAATLASTWTINPSLKNTERLSITLTLLVVFAVSFAIYYASRRDMGELAPAVTYHSESIFLLLSDNYKAFIGGYWGYPSYVIAVFTAAGMSIGITNRSTRAAGISILAIAIAAGIPIIAAYCKGMWIFSRYSLFSVPFFMLAAAHGISAFSRRVKISEPQLALGSVVLALALLLSMNLQGRSPYDLEHFKESKPGWPALNR